MPYKCPIKRKEYLNAWQNSNREYCREICKDYYFSHKAASRERKLKYLVNKKQRIPIWANHKMIRDFYIQCPEGHEVDHIVPLNGENVCGLHVEYNLQYLSPFENRSKSNKIKDSA